MKRLFLGLTCASYLVVLSACGSNGTQTNVKYQGGSAGAGEDGEGGSSIAHQGGSNTSSKGRSSGGSSTQGSGSKAVNGGTASNSSSSSSSSSSSGTPTGSGGSLASSSGTPTGSGGTVTGSGGTSSTPLGTYPLSAALPNDAKVIFLHNSTGLGVYLGGVDAWFKNYNSTNGKSYAFSEKWAPAENGANTGNFPYDFWNGWVNHPGTAPTNELDTLEVLTQKYNVIVFKHCFPVGFLYDDPKAPNGDVTSNVKSPATYRLQYAALKEKMLKFPSTRFLVWTPPALVKAAPNTEQAATNTKQFTAWLRNTWDEPGDNIFLFDFRALETGGDDMYLLPENAKGPFTDPPDSHPNDAFNTRVAPLFSKRVVDVIEGRAENTSKTGE